MLLLEDTNFGDPFHFDLDPDREIADPKIKKIQLFLFLV